MNDYTTVWCPKCGAVASIYWWRYGGHPNIAFEVFQGLVARCTRCGYEWRLKALDD